MNTPSPITAFKDEFRFLSNFWPCTVYLDNVHYPTVEHAYQAAKTLDMIVRDECLMLPKAGQVKKWGRALEARGLVRPDWKTVNIALMRNLNQQKYNNTFLGSRLLATGERYIIEGNNWGDRYWGAEYVNGDWVGENHMGLILMDIRKELRAHEALCPGPLVTIRNRKETDDSLQ